jgi:prepilin-type processing-associated H-X9-DG protein
MRRAAVWLSVLVFVLFILSCMGLVLPIEVPAVLALGWPWYLARTIPEIHIARSGVATAVACLLLLVVGLQYFLGWLYRELHNPGSDHATRGSRWKWRWTISLVAGVIVLFAAGTATVGVTHQLGWLITSKEALVVSDSDAVRRVQSTNKLKQIGLALASYEQAHHSFPPGGTFDRTGRALQSWQTLILPHMEFQAELYSQIDLAATWDDSRNRPVFQTNVQQYLRPGIDFEKNAAGYALSHYAANADMLGGDHSRTVSDISDGTTNTIMVGEVVSDFKPWGAPSNWRDARIGLNRSPQGFGSPSPGGASFLFVDGSVRFIKNAVDPQILKALSTPAGHEKISSDQY